MSAFPASLATPPQRNSAVDTYRGFVMLLMLAEVLHFSTISRSFPNSIFWHILAYNQSHVDWVGMSLHDMIQPSFTFLVGVALPYSLRSRLRKGEGLRYMLGHTIWRSLLLVTLGIFLRSIHTSRTNFTFEDTLTQIGLGYTFAFLLSLRSPRTQWIAFATILFGYWLAWALYPAPGPDFPYGAVGVPPGWHQHLLNGFLSHWNKNSNLGQAFDVRFLNLFPRSRPFLFNDGGYLTLSFIPTLGTMLLGLAAGRWLIADSPKIPFRKLLLAAVLLMGGGLFFHLAGICPIVKRVWTPSWTLFSGGVCFLFLSAFSWIVDVRRQQRLAFPLIVIGMNSIAAYLMSYLFEDFIQKSFRIHLGDAVLNLLGPALQPLVLGSLILGIYWVILFWMFRKKIFLRI
jgi:predicted acyltransferase